MIHRTEPPWLDERIRALRPGGKVRIGDGKLVSFNGKAFYLHDFREQQGELYEPILTLAERLALVKAQREADIEAGSSAALPTQDAMFHPQDWPNDARVWFYRAGINNDDITLHLRAFWSAKMRRVVVPYETLSDEAAWIARDTSWTKGTLRPKYLFPSGVSRGGGAVWTPRDIEHSYRGSYSGVVIVEDVLSAFRIARDTQLAAVAAQGTSLDRAALTQIAGASAFNGLAVFTWLDPDRYGQLGATRIRNDLGRLGVAVRNIVSDRDPKLLEPAALREALET